MMKKEISEEKSKTGIWYTILIIILTTCISQAVSFQFWKWQFADNNDQKLYEYKLASFEKFSNSGIKLVYLSEFTTRIKLKQAKIENTIGDSLYKSTHKRINTLGFKHKLSIQNDLKKMFPIEYENHMKFLEFQSETAGISSAIILQFNEKTRQSLYDFNKLFTLDTLFSEIRNQINSKAMNIYQIDDDYFSDLFHKRRVTQFNIVMSNMYEEIKNHH